MVKTADSYPCGRWFDSYLTYIFLKFLFVCFLELYVRVNKFSVMSGRFPLFIGLTSSKQWITCVIVTALAVSLELALAFRSPVSRSSGFFICSFTGTAECANVHVVPKIMFYMISHNNII